MPFPPSWKAALRATLRIDEARSYHPNLPPDPTPNNKMPYLGGAIGRYKYPPHAFEGFEDGL